MIKEILEYDGGPAPVPRLPMSAYPMGAVPGITDQISDHLKRNWLYYLLGGGMLLGPGMKKISAFNAANTKFQKYMADNTRLHQLLDSGKHDDILRAYGIDTTIGDPTERANRAKQLVADHDNQVPQHASNLQDKYNDASNSFANNVPFIGGVQNPFENGQLNFNGMNSGINWSSVNKNNQDEFNTRHTTAQNKVSDEYEKFMEKNPNAKYDDVRKHLRNTFKNDPDVNHDALKDENGQSLGIDHFIRSHADKRQQDREEARAYDAQKKAQEDLEKQQNKVDLVNSDPNSLDHDKRIERFRQVLDNDANLKSQFQSLTNWRDTFKTQIPEDHALVSLASSLGKDIPILKDFMPTGDEKDANFDNIQRLNSIYKTAQYIGTNKDDLARTPSSSEMMKNLALKAAETNNVHADALKNLNTDQDFTNYLKTNQNNILGDMENHMDSNVQAYLGNSLGKNHALDSTHINAIWKGTDYKTANPQVNNPNPNPNQNPNPNPTRESNTNINNLVGLYLTNEDSDEFGHDSGRVLEPADNSPSNFLKKHYGKILAGLGVAALNVGRNHLKANAHEANAQHFYQHGNRDLADSEFAKANIRRSIDPIYKIKQYLANR